MNIRPVKVKDWDKLVDLLQELVAEDPPVAIELEPLINKGDRWISQFPSGKLGYFVVVEQGTKIIGFCYIAVPTYYRPIAYIGLAIEAEHRGENLGSQLFYEVASWAASKEIQYIIADVWSWNHKSIRFFSHLGFIEKSRFEDKFKGEIKDKVRMVRSI
jgi:RimJ/RimL family protein N-acetyltransferase